MKTKKTSAASKVVITAAAVGKAKSEKKHLEVEELSPLAKVLHFNPSQTNGNELYRSLLNLALKSPKELAVDFDSFLKVLEKPLGLETVATAVYAAIEYGNNKVPFSMKTTKGSKLKHEVTNVPARCKKECNEAVNLASAQTQARRWQDMPNNFLYPSTFVEEIKRALKGLPVKINVLTHKQLLAKKMELICGVAQGSDDGARIVTLEYKTNAKAEKLALIGKGVCFDTGGYSLKTGGHMRGMKFDMSGAAAVVAAVRALAVNKVKTNVIGVVGLVENVVDSKSYRVDDVLTSYQGTTVEIDNTDAEGRLVLADCLAYAYKDLKADKLLTIATLTGAVIYALGSTFAGAWSKFDQDWDALTTAAADAAELIWRLPFHNDYISLLKTSHIADIKNSTNSPNAGSSRAACFLREFSSDKPYYHLDIAGMDSFADGSGSGPLVRTLYKLAAKPKLK
ncbi:leucyl aminopeptidase [Mycoplasmoides fastidiosum]|uniref:Probable cytosol aminopeptidase n=1 Tax=Mycoplasmoides fastidiosum TaxID=92758 RepID=A0ABU0LYU5_9BACT|nr:leucyl aminopeptidase [Mycoplasmoides fastidiosum]MDQ0513889.1 leucyl aminopeptidase [Mycoplasmoides fastidiosum]UUD37697.1 leucyl aminopeptidase [Mycoplasmoides fastidiosum]